MKATGTCTPISVASTAAGCSKTHRSVRSLAAFLEDLGPAREQVTLITISEFGRRARENESGGVDHGWGNVMFVAGGTSTRESTAIGRAWPLGRLEDGDLRATTDYRAVLWTCFAHRCGTDAAAINAVLPGWNGNSSG